MAASLTRACGFRLLAQRDIVSYRFVGQVIHSFHKQSPQQYITRSFSYLEDYGNSIKIKPNHVVEKVWTDSDVGVHDRICSLFVGRKRKALKKFILETGIKFKVHTVDADHILVSGKDAEVVKKAVELVTIHIDKIKTEIQSKVYENVFIDEDEDIRYKICGLLIGRNGDNIDRIRSDIGLEFSVLGTKDGHIRVSGTDAKVMKRVVDRLTLEIEKIRQDIEVFDQKINR